MSTIDPRRVWAVLRMQVLLHGRSLLAYFGPTLAVLFISAISERGAQSTILHDLYPFFLLFGGFVFAASCLPENKSPDGRQAFLTLPASDAEKWLASYLYAGPFFFVAGTLGYWVLTLIVQGTFAAFSLGQPEPFNPLARLGDPELVVSYWFGVVPLGLLAAILFDKGSWIKMIGSVIVGALAVAALAALTFRVVFREYFTGFWRLSGESDMHFGGSSLLDEHGLLLTALTGLFLLAVSYFRFQEKEV